MFELSREDMCNWRKEHNRIEEFKGMPNHKNLEQSNMQIEEEIVKVKQQKKMPEPTHKEDMSMQEMLRIILENSRKPVSYTHLDVYKRQCLNYPEKICVTGGRNIIE